MPVLVDTEKVAPAERFDLWAQVSAEVFEPLQVEAPETQEFSARLARHRLGPLDIDRMTADTSSATRTPALIRAQDPDQIKLMLQLRGRCAITQGERMSVVRPRQLTSWHSSRPYTIAGETRFDVLIVHCPSAVLGTHAARIRGQTAQLVESDSRIATVVSRYLTELVAGLDEGAFEKSRQGHLAEGVLDLIRAVLCPAQVSGEAPPRSSDALRAEVSAYIDAHLTDPELDPGSVARAHFISRSYLNKLFECEDAGVGGTIKARRLDRARRDLADPSLAHESVLEIASRWGFASASHFSRSFRTAYGVPPREFREQMAAAG
jgi:AraC-like DNA-binding protein